MSQETFFGKPKQQSIVKAEMVSGYFTAWARVMANNAIRYPSTWPDRFSYVDLFAGRGRYEDGSPCTAAMVLKRAIDVPAIRERVSILLNDVDPTAVAELRKTVASTPGLDLLRDRPRVTNLRVDAELTRQLQRPMVPTLFFLDPWGYKGLSFDLVSAAIKDRGSECILFFNFNRVNMHLANSATQQSLADLFGEERLDALRPSLRNTTGTERENIVMNAAEDALRETGGTHIRGFRFMDRAGSKTSHYVIHVAKDYAAYDIMRNIMAGKSSSTVGGLASYSFDPTKDGQLSLFDDDGGVRRLACELTQCFAGRTLTREQITRAHSVGPDGRGTDYRDKDYREALLLLESEGRITCVPEERPEGTLAPHVEITFDENEGTDNGTVKD